MIFHKRKYKFTNKHNARGGIASVIVGIGAVILFGMALYMTYQDRGSSGIEMGVTAMTSFLLSTIGLILGLSSFKEEDRFYVCSWIGTVLCGILWLLLCAIIIVGI